jgi:cation:H+ antiporter
LPELTVSFKSLRAGKNDIVIGNVIGSCMFNMLLIGGIASVLKPQVISSEILVWVIVGLLLSVVLLMASSLSKRIHIWEGFIYMLLYLAVASRIGQF